MDCSTTTRVATTPTSRLLTEDTERRSRDASTSPLYVLLYVVADALGGIVESIAEEAIGVSDDT